MKKKIITLCMVLVLALSAVVMTGCNLVYNVGTIEWVQKPATVYSLNETEKPSFTIRAQIEKQDPVTITYPNGEYDSKITIKNFTTATTGTRTATVTYENLTLSFSYQVIDGEFAGGTGSEIDPYVVTTPKHFQNMLNQKSFKYYVLGNTIDFAGKYIKMANNGQDATDAEAWTGVIDGNGYSLTGISEVRTPDDKAINKYNEMFGRVARANEKFVMKNLTVAFASTGASATMGLVTSNGTNGEIEFENVKLTGYINAANSGNSNISPFVSFLERTLPGKVQAPLKSLTLKNCESDLKILNAYATSIVAGFASAQSFVLPTGSVKFENCKFNGLIEGSYQQGAGAFFANNDNKKNDALAFTNCTVGENAKIIKTAGRGLSNSEAAMYNCGNVALYDVTTADGITGEVAVDSQSLKDAAFTVADGVLTCEIEGAVKYEIYAVGTMTYENGKGGAFRYVQPATAAELKTGYTLLKIKSDATGTTENTVTTYGSNLIVNENGTLVYYCGTVCQSINVKTAKLVVVAYNEAGTAIAIGTSATTVNLAA